MKDLRELNHLRDRSAELCMYGSLPTSEQEVLGGVFRVPVKSSKRPLLVIVSNGAHPAGMGWDHVSVSLPARCPTWEEMDHIKRLFFRPDEVAMQLHVGDGDHISNHAYCLHIWRPVDQSLPLPPSIMVGIKDLGTFAA
ncbi:MAG: hypothetical protein K2Q27_02440 [Novosphingobium sp.]|nr:hypothetical protein [Novosphingobium sp.]